MTAGFFVTGTDTHVGKTFVSVELMSVLRQAGLRVGGMKPVASGGLWVSGQWRNEDALLLEMQASVRLPYEWVNPFAFMSPVSPHLAAREEGRAVCLDAIKVQFGRIQEQVDCVVVEGAGGWLSPLGQGLDVADLAKSLDLPVIMVVGIRLGCINHARLTEKMIRGSEVAFAGWVANFIDPTFSGALETLETLTQLLGQAPLASVGFRSDLCKFDQAQYNHWNRGEILRRMIP